MLIQLIFQVFIIGVCTVIVAYIAYLSGVVMKRGVSGIPAYLCAYISETLPLNSLLAVVLQMAYALMGCKIISTHISNHVIISLDILYIESLLLIFFCYTIKGFRDSLQGNLV